MLVAWVCEWFVFVVWMCGLYSSLASAESTTRTRPSQNMIIGAAHYRDENKSREKALNNVMQHGHYEYENTGYICIGHVSKTSRGARLRRLHTCLLTGALSWTRFIWRVSALVLEKDVPPPPGVPPPRHGGWPAAAALLRPVAAAIEHRPPHVAAFDGW